MVQWLTKKNFVKGNDQTRFEMAFLAIDPKIKIIAPWRLPKFFKKFDGRQALLDYAAQTGIPVTSTKAKPYSMDDNIAHCGTSQPPPDDMWTR
jgi:argininosuccinate synthase